MTTISNIDNNGFKMTLDNDTKSLTLDPSNSLTIDYDLTTANPKQFRISSAGVNFTDNTSNNTTGLQRIALVQQAFAAVDLPPNATTLQINNTLLATNAPGTNSITIDASADSIIITNGTTTNTINTSGYTTRNSTQNLTHFLNFSDSSSTGTGAIQKTSGIECNPSTKTITATTFVGDLSGNATTATTATNIDGGAGGSIPYQSASSTTALLANGTSGQVLTSQGTTLAPIWTTPTSNLHFYDEQWCLGAATNGLLGFEDTGSGSGTISVVNAEVGHYGIIKNATAASNTNSIWSMNSPLLWSNINYYEVVFRGWNTGTSTNTTLSVGLFNSKTSLTTTGILLVYSNFLAPTNVWNILVDGSSVGSFTGTLATQNVGVWLKIRVTNTNDTGSFSATLTRLDTNVSETITGSGIDTGTQIFLGGGLSCISGNVSKNMDFDSFELQLK
jgi:hypothetical protein